MEQTFRSSHPQIFFKISVLKAFANFTRQHLCWSLFFFNKVVFCKEIFKIFRDIFFYRTSLVGGCFLTLLIASPSQNMVTLSIDENIRQNNFFSIWVFFQKHPRFTGQQRKGEVIYLTPFYNVHPLHRNLDISRAITESSPLHIASSRTQTVNFWFPSTSH